MTTTTCPQAESFAFDKTNQTRAKTIIARYPKNCERSALLPLLDLAQRQNDGWLSRSAIEHVASIININPIRAYEVATFYTMFNLKPVGKYHIQLCGTTPCWLRGAGELMQTCRDLLGISHGQTSSDNIFTLTEVECLGACVNAPMVQINDDYYEDLTVESFTAIINKLKQGNKVSIGSQTGRTGSEPQSATTTKATKAANSNSKTKTTTKKVTAKKTATSKAKTSNLSKSKTKTTTKPKDK